MKEFDLEKAKAGAELCTRKGLPARIICYDRVEEDYPIVALTLIDGFEDPDCYTKDGKYSKDNNSYLRDFDLMLAD